MQKKLIALAVAAAATAPAFAADNVTVYGVVDAYFARASADGVKATSAINSGGLSGSRIGFKGTEDLGNGLTALFVLEYGIDADSKTGLQSSTGGRQQLLGLTGSFGTVVAGRAQTAGYDFACATSAYAGSQIDAYSKVTGTSTSTTAGSGTPLMPNGYVGTNPYQLLSCGSSGRADNAFAYISPSFGGVTFAYNHARVTESRILDSSATENAYANLLAVKYAGGPVAVNAVYAKINADKNLGTDVKEVGVNGSYDLGVVKLFASYQTYDLTVLDNKNKQYGVSASIPVGGAGAVHVGYAKSKLEEVASDAGAKSYTLAYTHSLSKRTTAYAGYNQLKNETAATSLGSFLNPDTTVGLKSSTIAFGMRHTF